MQAASAPPTEEFWFGDVAVGTRQPWMSPVLLGLGAPIVLGLLLAPQFLSGVSSLIIATLVFLMVMACGAYALSVLLPGTPGTVIVSPQSRTLTVVRYGMLANSSIEIPFGEITRIELATELTRELNASSFVHLHTRAGDVWSIPADITKKEADELRALIRPNTRR